MVATNALIVIREEDSDYRQVTVNRINQITGIHGINHGDLPGKRRRIVFQRTIWSHPCQRILLLSGVLYFHVGFGDL